MELNLSARKQGVWTKTTGSHASATYAIILWSKKKKKKSAEAALTGRDQLRRNAFFFCFFYPLSFFRIRSHVMSDFTRFLMKRNDHRALPQSAEHWQGRDRCVPCIQKMNAQPRYKNVLLWKKKTKKTERCPRAGDVSPRWRCNPAVRPERRSPNKRGCLVWWAWSQVAHLHFIRPSTC